MFIIKLQSGSNSAVECDLAKVEVAGSNPVSRSMILAIMPAHARALSCVPNMFDSSGVKVPCSTWWR